MVVDATLFASVDDDRNLFSSAIVNMSAFPESACCGLERCRLCGLVQFNVLGWHGIVANCWLDRCLSGVAFLQEDQALQFKLSEH